MNFTRRQVNEQDERVEQEDAQRNSEMFDPKNQNHLASVLDAVSNELGEDSRQLIPYSKPMIDPLMQIAIIVRDKMPILKAIEMGKGIINLKGFKAPTSDIEFAVLLAKWSEVFLSPNKDEKLNEAKTEWPAKT